MARVHKKSREHICLICDARFYTDDKLLRHQQTVHNSENRAYECECCGGKYKRRDHLRRHYKNVHHIVDHELELRMQAVVSCLDFQSYIYLSKFLYLSFSVSAPENALRISIVQKFGLPSLR